MINEELLCDDMLQDQREEDIHMFPLLSNLLNLNHQTSGSKMEQVYLLILPFTSQVLVRPSLIQVLQILQ